MALATKSMVFTIKISRSFRTDYLLIQLSTDHTSSDAHRWNGKIRPCRALTMTKHLADGGEAVLPSASSHNPGMPS